MYDLPDPPSDYGHTRLKKKTATPTSSLKYKTWYYRFRCIVIYYISYTALYYTEEEFFFIHSCGVVSIYYTGNNDTTATYASGVRCSQLAGAVVVENDKVS